MAGNWLNSTNVTSREDWIIIGISGVTCGGKTSLASMLREHVAPVHVFNQDRYFYPDDSPRHVRCDGLEHNNYDILGALDMEQMMTDVNLTLRGEDRAHETCTEVSEGTFSAPGKRFLVLEGFTALNYPPIMELCDLRYYLVLEFDECVRRRSLRVYEPPDVAGYFERCVWPEHVRYRAQIEKDGRVQILDGTDPYTFDAVMSDIRSYASLLH